MTGGEEQVSQEGRPRPSTALGLFGGYQKDGNGSGRSGAPVFTFQEDDSKKGDAAHDPEYDGNRLT